MTATPNPPATQPEGGTFVDDQMLRLATALTDLDRYREMADKLAGAIADLLDIEIGEHSSDNDPWQKALDAAQVAGFVVEQANARARATMQMANEANAKLRALLLTALRIDDDGRTSLTGYVEALIADRDAAHAELDDWRSGRRGRMAQPPAVNDGLTYAARLLHAQGTDSGPEHDDLLREASMRLKALNDLAAAQQDELDLLREERDAAHAAGRTAAAEDLRQRIERVWPDPMGRWSAEQAAAGRAVKNAVRRAFAEETRIAEGGDRG